MSGLQGRTRRTVFSGLVLSSLLALTFATGARGAPGDATASRVADIRPGPIGSNPQTLFNAGGTLLFNPDDGTNGVELWKSNGGPLGPGGTEMVANINSTAPGNGSNPGDFTDVNGTVFFVANDGINGSELWRIAPLFTTPTMVENINPTTSGVLSPAILTNVNDTLFFAADDGTNGEELWKSVAPYDADSTERVKDINTGAGSSNPNLSINANGTLLFTADEGGTFDEELWRSVAPYDSDSTTKIDMGTGPSFPGPFVNINGTVLFGADDGIDGFELWKIEPPYTTPVQVEDINATGDADVSDLIDVNGTAFFAATDGSGMGEHGQELWKSVPPFDPDNTSVIDINPGPDDSDAGRLTNIGGALFLRADDGVSGVEVWKSNGGPPNGGTDLVADINPGGAGSFPFGFEDVGGTAFFGANEPVTGQELWKSSGVGATVVADIFSGDSGSAPGELTNVGGTLFFRANDGIVGPELWKATIEGPAPVVTPIVTPVVMPPAPTFNLAAAIKKCKKKFPKGKKRKKCIKRARARARA